MALTNMTIEAFKAATSTQMIQIIINPKTKKAFGVDEMGNTYRCYQFGIADDDVELKKQVKRAKGWRVLVEDEDLTTACLVPEGVGAEVLVTL